jgi:Cdc6-like AAA superfamily ATPase
LTPEQEKYQLPLPLHQFIANKIYTEAIKENTPVSNPIAIFLAGQPGSGKTDLGNLALEQLKKNAVYINTDEFRNQHPSYIKLLEEQNPKASFLVDPDAAGWTRKLLSDSIKDKRNILFDMTLGGNVEVLNATLIHLRKQGYQTQINVLAIPAFLSKTGIYERFCNQLEKKGYGRWVSMESHDTNFGNIPKNIQSIESGKLVDKIVVYSKDSNKLNLIYENNLENGEWKKIPIAQIHLEKERNKILTPKELQEFNTRTNEIATKILALNQSRILHGINISVHQFKKDVDVPITQIPKQTEEKKIKPRKPKM